MPSRGPRLRAAGIRGHGGAAAPWTPLSIPGYTADYDSRYHVTGTTSVTAWGDNSGQGVATAFGNAGLSYPSLTASDAHYNGLPSIAMSGAPQGLITTAWSSAISQPCTIYYVAYTNTVALQILADGIASGNRLFFGVASSGGHAVSTIYAGSSEKNGSAHLEGVPFIAAVVFNNAADLAYVNTSGTADISSSGAGTNTLTGLLLGESHSGGAGWTGTCARIIVCTGGHSTGTISTVFTNLGALYGIAAS